MDAVNRLRAFIDSSPTPFHAVESAESMLVGAGFVDVTGVLGDHGSHPAPRSFVRRGGSLIAWSDGDDPHGPLRLIGAHTDSPNLRIRPIPETASEGIGQLSVEVYGSALVNSWLDRDLGIAGRVAVRGDSAMPEMRLFRSDRPELRVAQLAIHLDRDVNERGLQLNRQQHLNPIWSLGAPGTDGFRRWLAERVYVEESRVLAWDAACFDFQDSALIGRDLEFIAAGRLDNLVSCFGALEALIASVDTFVGGPASNAAVALFDHEEVGSTTASGAASVWLGQVLEARALSLGMTRAQFNRILGESMMVSADMAHATHPNYAERHEPNHRIRLGGGPVIKYNVNARYATDSMSAACFMEACRAAGVGFQEYSHRGDMPCGSTIGPISAAGLAIDTVDVGMAQLSMHSAREMMASADVDPMLEVFTEWLL